MKIKYNKFWITLVFFMVTMGMQAHMPKSHLKNEKEKKLTKKQYEKEKDFWVKNIAEKQKDSLACENENKRLDSLTTDLSQRTFRLSNPQYVEEKFLSHYKNLNVLIEDSANVRNFIKWLATKSKSNYADTYLKVLDMAASLDTIYDAKKNEGYCKDIANIKNKKMLFQDHRKGFETLASNVKDYNFVMFELSRVFDIVDNKKECSYKALKNSGETKFIDNIPYAKKQLQDYIDVSEQRKAIRVKLKKACSEAF